MHATSASSPRPDAAGRSRRGFTLLELLVVMLLLTLVIGTVAPSLTRWTESARERGWRSDLEAVLRSLPVRAFQQGMPLEIDARELRRALAEAPEDVELELTQPLRYGPTGRSEGGELRITRKGVRSQERWVVQAGSGEVTRPLPDGR